VTAENLSWLFLGAVSTGLVVIVIEALVTLGNPRPAAGEPLSPIPREGISVTYLRDGNLVRSVNYPMDAAWASEISDWVAQDANQSVCCLTETHAMLVRAKGKDTTDFEIRGAMTEKSNA
jgi:hypothetical protein